MKFRSAILFACMAIVPLTAMFSHKVPRTWRSTAWRLATGAGDTSRKEPTTAAAPPVHPVADTPPSAPSRSASPPLAAIESLPRREAEPARGGPVDAAAPEVQLRALGASSIECKPLAGGMYRCSCRVAADPSGQLQRVFQTSNPDPAAGLRTLLGQVQFWKHRMTSRPTAAAGQPRSPDAGAVLLR